MRTPWTIRPIVPASNRLVWSSCEDQCVFPSPAVAFQRYGRDPLTADECDTYVEQAGWSAERLGVIDPPRTVAELETVLADYRPELEATDAALGAARFLLAEPPLPLAAGPGYWAIASGGVALLDPWARRELGLPSSVLLARGVLAPLGRASAATVRWAMAGNDDQRTA